MNRLFISIAVVVTAFLESCDSLQDLNPPGDNMSGIITYVDSNLITSTGYYAVSIFSADSTNPFHRVPLRSDSLVLTRLGNAYETIYDMNGISEGRYYVASTWVRYPRIPNEIPKVLGTYGCDTSITCTNYIVIHYPNFEGASRDILSWTDTLRSLN